MEAELKARIKSSKLFVHMVPPEGEYEDRARGEEMLAWAMECRLPIMLYRVTGRQHLPVPAMLDDYEDYSVFDGDVDGAAAAIRAFYEVGPEQGIEVDSQGY